MRSSFRFFLPALLVTLAVACQAPADQAPAAPGRTTDQVQADVGALANTWVELANARDVAGVADLYTDDAVFVDPYGNVHEGRTAITAYLDQSLARASDWSVVTTGVVADGDLAVAYGTYSVTVTGPEGAMAQNGFWQSVAVYQPDGSTKLRLHLSMTPAPVPGM